MDSPETEISYPLIFFADNLGTLADRLIGPFDIEAVVDPIGVKISDAIMNFQNSGYEVTGKVFEECGRPRLQKRQVCLMIFHYINFNILILVIILSYILERNFRNFFSIDPKSVLFS